MKAFAPKKNIFCEYCEEVFLKLDNEYYIKYIGRSSTKLNMHLPKKIKIFESSAITKLKTIFEYIEIPITEK